MHTSNVMSCDVKTISPGYATANATVNMNLFMTVTQVLITASLRPFKSWTHSLFRI
jgi:hypothetical protein